MAVNAPGNSESVFTYGAPRLKVGAGASAEIGYDIAQLGAKRALLITDAGVAATGAPARIAEQMRAYGVECELFDDVHEKSELVVTFLALLEMIRLKLVRVYQTAAFGEIRIYKRQRPADAPHPIGDAQLTEPHEKLKA